ncbi:hypothetical protein PENTCL1PPCAC_23163 [Pristionchus entomophagus]|uniref:Cell division cycle protein 27 homolog n=1 Tax=Pristionchus entomophagus TaxID=358040 RepID=A0AAV5U3H8_9BILA|nr:hypothetical protein PENTCL1PPCAC_23163 [Pristionchus entomophagus]
MVANVGRPLASTINEHIDDCIQHYAYEDALFLAEMNHDQENSEETLLLLADCYFRTNRLDELFHLLADNPLANPRVRYIFAACCFELKKHDECMRALAGTSPNTCNRLHPDLAQSYSAPFAYNLLSKLYCKESRTEEALEAAEKSARLNCLHWSAVQEYLYLGGKEPEEVFSPVLKQFSQHISDENEDAYEDVEDENNEEEDDPSSHSTPQIFGLPPIRHGAAPRKMTKKSSSDTSTLPIESRRYSSASLRSARSLRPDVENETLMTGKRPSIPRAAKSLKDSKSSSLSRGEIASKSPKRKAEPKPFPLSSRNSNLNPSSTSSTRTSVARKIRSTPSGGARTPSIVKRESTTTPIAGASTASSPHSTTSEKDVERMAHIVQRMYHLTLVHYHFSNFKLAEAENEIAAMNPQAQDTSQVTLARARIMVEKGAYKSARMLLESHHKRFPHKVDGMEMLSTALWQEQDTHSLSALATTLTTRAKDRAESWCAAANSFSLAKQHSQAVQCLERAIKLNPRFVYSYTLLGCELIEMEELEKAGKAFRAALCVRPRDYRAYYGLGMVNQKKEQLNLAQLDIGKAIEINGQNSVLYCAMSSVLHSRGDIQGALLVINKALAIDEHSVAAHYHKARYLYDVRDYSSCLQVLEKLKERASDEANVYFLLGKVHKRLGDTDKALLNFHWASNMDPRGESMLSDLGEHFEEEGSSHT